MDRFYRVREKEIERAKAENGADVRRINDKRVARDRENSGDGIDRENEVHHIDDDEDKRERRQHPAIVDLDGEIFSVKFIGHMNGAPDEAHDHAGLKVLLAVLSRKHAHGGDEQEAAEKIENKMKMLDQRDTEPDHHSAHDQRANNSPNENAMLRDRRHAKVGKDQNEDEDVIDAERVLDQVAG